MATQIGTVNITVGAGERIVGAGGDALQLKQELLNIKADGDTKYYTDIFSNTDTAVMGSFEAGSFTVRLQLRNGNTEERVAGQEITNQSKITIKEITAFPNKERNTVKQYWLPEELAMADATAVASKISQGQLQDIRNELEGNSVQAMVDAAKAEYLNGRTEAYTFGWDFTTMSGEEILDDITDNADILLEGDKNNKAKQTYTEEEISILVNNRVWRKLANTFSKMGTGSEIQAKMLLNNSIPQGIMGGLYFAKAPASIMGPTVPVIMGTNGMYGSLLKKRRIRIFVEEPSSRAGELQTYITYRDMNKVVMPETVFVFSTDPTAPTKMLKKQIKKKTNKS